MTNSLVTDVQRDRALDALREITAPSTIGEFLRRDDHEGGAFTLTFACLMPGYVGWEWTVALAELVPGAPSVLEAELTPTDDALVAPEWVPWSQRLAEYLEAQKQAGIDEAAALAQVQAEIEAESGVDPFDDDDDDADDEADDDSDESDDDDGADDDFDELSDEDDGPEEPEEN